MSSQSLVVSYLAWGSILLKHSPQSHASEIHPSAIVKATRQKRQLLSRRLRKRKSTTTFSSNGIFDSNNPALPHEQYRQCVDDMRRADVNRDGKLGKPEFLRFVSYNSAPLGYQLGPAGGQVTMSELPLEFPMLFHSVACMCAYDPGADFGCCEGDNGHIAVYGEEEEGGEGGGMTREEAAYTSMFCAEAYHSYGVTFAPTRVPTRKPTLGPTVVLKTPKPTAMPTPLPKTSRPTAKPSMGPTQRTPASISPIKSPTRTPTVSPSTEPVTMAPEARPTTSPTAEPTTVEPTTKPTSAAPTEETTSEPTAKPISAAPTARPVEETTSEPTTSPNVPPSTPPSPTSSVVTLPPTRSPTTASPTKTATPAPTAATPVPTTTKGATAPPTTRPFTAPPSASPIATSTNSPSDSPTAQPTTSPPTTSSPTDTPGTPILGPVTVAPTRGATGTPTAGPSTSPVRVTASPSLDPTDSPTAKPTPSPITESPTTSSPTKSPTRSVVAVDVTYGISSNCNMTASDVINGNYGITIKEGLISATESVVVDILNATWPRGVDGGSPMAGNADAPGDDAAEGAEVLEGGEVSHQKDPSISKMLPGNGVRMRTEHMEGPKETEHETVEEDEGTTTPGGDTISSRARPGEGVRVRIEGSPRGPDARRLAMLANERRQHHRQPRLDLELRTSRPHRSLVYYTTDNPVVITDMVDVACSPEINCMRVESTIYLQLEEGDNADAVRVLVKGGVSASIESGGLFGKIPTNIVFCPPYTMRPTSSPTLPRPTSSSPTLSPSAVPTTSAPVTSAPVTAAPFAAPKPPTMSPSDARQPTLSPTVGGPSPTSSPISSELRVPISYELSNDCGLTGQMIMDEEGNTLKVGLVAAMTTVAIDILNTTFPRAAGGEEEELTRRNNVRARRRGLARVADVPPSSTMSPPEDARPHHRNLVYYTDEHPVIVLRVLDVESGCKPGINCLLVVSTIPVILEPGDDRDAIKAAILEGVQTSFQNGSFSAALPVDTVICPSRREA